MKTLIYSVLTSLAGGLTVWMVLLFTEGSDTPFAHPTNKLPLIADTDDPTEVYDNQKALERARVLVAAGPEGLPEPTANAHPDDETLIQGLLPLEDLADALLDKAVVTYPQGMVMDANAATTLVKAIQPVVAAHHGLREQLLENESKGNPWTTSTKQNSALFFGMLPDFPELIRQGKVLARAKFLTREGEGVFYALDVGRTASDPAALRVTVISRHAQLTLSFPRTVGPSSLWEDALTSPSVIQLFRK